MPYEVASWVCVRWSWKGTVKARDETCKWLYMVTQMLYMFVNGYTWLNMVINGCKWLYMIKNCYKRFENGYTCL